MTLRSFFAADGGRWSVWRVEPAALLAQPGAPGAWLVFVDEGGTQSRRLFDIPANWETLPPERLDLLRRIAEPAPGRSASPLAGGWGELSAPAAERAASSRTFSDGAGVVWQVWEVRPSLLERRRMRERREAGRPGAERRQSSAPRSLVAVQEDLRDGWLAFRSAFEHRRRAPIPESWTEMTDAELSEVLAHAVRFERTRRGTG